MNEQPMRDMVPPEGGDSRSIRKVQINKDEQPTRETSASKQAENGQTLNKEAVRRENIYTSRNRGMHKGWFVVIGLILLVFIFLALTPIFAGARIEVMPKFQDVEINGDYTAVPQGAEVEADIEYQIANFEVVEEVSVPATGEEEVSRRASGRIRVYNEFSADAERLIANTRFETESGLVYRVQDAITIPGYVEQNGSIVPGTLEVTVHADEPGERYNINSAKFTIPGLAGDERFDKMRAETVTLITGGFEGITKVANEADVAKAIESARENLHTKMAEKARTETPEGFVLLEDTLSVEFESLPQESDGDRVVVRERALGSAALLLKNELAALVARETIGAYEGDDVRLEDLNSITISVSEENDIVGETVMLNIEGSPKVVWAVDYESLADDLYGSSKGEALEAMSSYGSIQSAEVKISPFWKRTIPTDAGKVSVEEVLE